MVEVFVFIEMQTITNNFAGKSPLICLTWCHKFSTWYREELLQIYSYSCLNWRQAAGVQKAWLLKNYSKYTKLKYKLVQVVSNTQFVGNKQHGNTLFQ